MISAIPSGATLGVFGGGQLGRMFAQSAKRLGYKTHVFCPDKESPAFEVCDEYTVASYEDAAAVAKFGAAVQVVTFEFENIPVEAIAHLPKSVPVRPRAEVLHVCQNRGREKAFLSKHGFPLAPYRPIASEADIEALRGFKFPGVMKTAGFGYDGKGQCRVASVDEARAFWEKSGRPPMVLEGFIDFGCEVSVIVARDLFGKEAHWGVFENRHANHILDVTLWPSELSAATRDSAVSVALEVARKLDVVGLLAVEFFVEKNGTVLVNELAPRPHNSGHVTMDAAVTSQFEQHVRAITGIGLGDTSCRRPGAMVNLLGDVWKNGEPKWHLIPKESDSTLHLYGKKDPRSGRKMGHLNVLDENAKAAAVKATALRSRL